MKYLIIILVYLVCCLSLCLAGCHNRCNGHGVCSPYGICECFSAWTGTDCSARQCPSGPTVGQIPDSKDSAHPMAICSGRGDCNPQTGLCACYPGFAGPSCGQMFCYNNCNGHGECVSLGVAATAYDGYRFNRTTTYTRWDANMFYGCKCDIGWGGADCSERQCDYGIDPRLPNSGNYHELVTLVCICSPTCVGKFKLRLMGQPTVPWMNPSSTANDLQIALTTVSGQFANNGVYSYARVSSVNGSFTGMLCPPNAVTKTVIKFRKNVAETPLVSFYANLITGGSMYFETKETLTCDCTKRPCNGTFRLSFDGEMSPRLHTWGNGTDIVRALQAMQTLAAAGAYVDTNATSMSAVCVNGKKTNHSIVIKASAGNMPRLGLWSSVVPYAHPGHYSTDNTSNVLYLSTADGRENSVQLCNGIGTCNFKTGVCDCPYGWGPDPNIGPCGQIVYNSSAFPGIGRCPGIVAAGDTQGLNELTGLRNYHRVYTSANPVLVKFSIVLGGVRSHNTSSVHPVSVIQYFDWVQGLSSYTFSGPGFSQSSRTVFLNLTSNVSAGPIFLDQSRQQMFFVDMNPAGSFIGVAPLTRSRNASTSTPHYRVFLTLTRTVFGFTADARAERRVLYWTTPGSAFVADGRIKWAYMDVFPVVAYSLTPIVGAEFVVDPMGIAVHHIKQRLYWVDKNLSFATREKSHSVLRSCNFDGTGYRQVYLYRQVDNSTGSVPVSVNATDLIIDYFHNNTAFMIDSSPPQAIIATNLDFPLRFNSTDAGDRFSDMMTTHVVETPPGMFHTPRYLGLDIDVTLVLWTDPGVYKVNYARYVPIFLDHFATGAAYSPPEQLQIHSVYQTDYAPVGITFDPGLGPPNFPYQECFGRGICTGFSGNFNCQCDIGSYGNCQPRTCPWAPAWWSEPIVNEIAHDQLMECANMGTCDRVSGQCNCRPGFEGSSCERMLCQGQLAQFNFCSGRGTCLSLRELANKHVDQYLSPDPVVYGALPNDPATWDADMIYGCNADVYGYSPDTGTTNITSYIGETLTDLSCPYGYNMRLTDKIFKNHTALHALSNSSVQLEMQQFVCSGTSGYFTLAFRGVVSPPILVNSTLAILQKQLLSVTSLATPVTLAMADTSSDATICSATSPGNYVNITFVATLGIVPLITVPSASISGGSATVFVQRIQPGFGPLYECSGKGDCDRSQGICKCWDSWGSSDGFGDRGTRGDCGYSLSG